MKLGPLRLLSRRWTIVLLAGAVIIGAGAAFYLIREEPAAPRAVQGKPPVGAFSIEKRAGETDFAVQTEDGRVNIRTGGTAPSDMPYGFPLYPGAAVTDSVNLAGATASSGRMVNFTSPDAPDRVIGHYRKLAQTALLRIVTDRQIGDARILEGIHPQRDDGGFHLSVRAGAAGGSRAMLSAGFGQDVTHRPASDPALVETDMLLSPPAGAP